MSKPTKKEKFIHIYNLYVAEVYQFVYLRTGCKVQQSEDITQEIFMNVYKGIDTFKGLSSDRTWVFKIARNKVNDYYRNEYRGVKTTDIYDEKDEFIDEMQNIENLFQTEYEREGVRICLNRIPEQYKILLIMKYVEEMRQKEIASFFGKTPKAVERMLSRAKVAFIKEYEHMEKEG